MVMSENIDTIRKWAKDRAKNASTEQLEKKSKKKRSSKISPLEDTDFDIRNLS